MMDTPMTSTHPTLMYLMGLEPKKIGGFEKFLRYLATELNAAGWHLVLCFDGEPSELFLRYIQAPNVQVEYLGQQSNLGLKAAVPLWKLLRQYRPTAVVYAFHGVMRCFPWLARLGGAKSIWFNDHSSRAPGQATRPLALPKRIVGLFLTAPLTGIISVSDFTRRTGKAYGLTSVDAVVISNGVVVPAPDPSLRGSFRQRFGIPQDALVIAQVCWMVAVKGVETMLRAAAPLLLERPNLRLLLAGDGPLIDSYKALAVDLGIDSQTIFTGLLENPTGIGLFQGTDIYCQPSIWQEACPLAVLEAMSVGVPVIASDIGGLPELVQQDRTGLLVPVGDVDALSAAVRRLADDPDLRGVMGEAGSRCVLAHHQLDVVARRYRDLILPS
jgi:glycosyltransferase involved in cell wall biosynthesis